MPSADTTVSGNVNDGFEAVRDVLTSSIDSGEDLGASVAVIVDGEVLVDIWGGWSDRVKEAGTITKFWSRPPRRWSL